MQRTISSAHTAFTKFAFPAIWITLVGLGTVLMWLDQLKDEHGVGAPEGAKWSFLLLWVAGTAFIIYLCSPLKRVRLDSDSLYVSNYFREVRISLVKISAVTENRWINIHPVTIVFKDDIGFGRRITFMPKVRWFALWSPHPVVQELRQLAHLPSA